MAVEDNLTEEQIDLVSDYELHLMGVDGQKTEDEPVSVAAWRAQSEVDQEEDLKNWVINFIDMYVQLKIQEAENNNLIVQETALKAKKATIDIAISQWTV